MSALRTRNESYRTVTMRSGYLLLMAFAMELACSTVYADDTHGGGVFHAFHLGVGAGSNNSGDRFADWDLHGWIGTDENKFWLKSEGERNDGETEEAEYWVLYSRNIATFWDLQIGARYDTKPHSLSYAVVGYEGLAPYAFETEAHLFISEEGDVSARIRQEMEWLFTQRLIATAYYEADLYAQDVAELDVGAGIAAAEIGIQTRYEITRTVAPYLEIKYERKLGETSSIARRNGEDSETVIGTVGMKFLF